MKDLIVASLLLALNVCLVMRWRIPWQTVVIVLFLTAVLYIRTIKSNK